MSDGRRVQVSPVWKGKNGTSTPISELTDEHLQRAFTSTQRRVIRKDRAIRILFELMDMLEEEAVSRGITLTEVSDLSSEKKVYTE